MMFRFSALLLLLLASNAAAGENARGTALDTIEGTFIQYQEWMMNLDGAAWNRELDAMRRAGINTVVIQWLEYENSRFIPSDSTAPDPTDIILEYADRHGMRVFIGLATDDRWWERTGVRGYLERSAALSVRLASIAWERYGSHASFAGWYIPQELRYGDYAAEDLASIRQFVRRESDRCRALSGPKPVAIAPALIGRPPIERFREIFAELFSGSGVDVAILQDGVGAQRRGGDMDSSVVPYFRAMRAVCRNAGIELWSDIEIFQQRLNARGSEPAALERIKRQIAAESPFVSAFVMFDFFHYMSPYRGDAQKKLYKDYLRELASRARPSR